MAIGLGLRRKGPGGRVSAGRGGPRTSVREVCLIGLDLRSAGDGWPGGREVTWLGRTYRVRATDGDGLTDPADRRYVHLSACGGE